MTQRTIEGQEAFCATCPSPEEVGAPVQALGFCLTFQMSAVISPPYEQVAPLPAQFHFQDQRGNEVIYLQGRDSDPDGLRLPGHASRFWAYPGRNQDAYRRVTHALATRWTLEWQHIKQVGQDAA